MAGKAQAKQGTVLRASGKDGPQIVATGEHRWDQADERIFLDTLAATCNVRASAAAAGFSTAAIYWRRRHHPDFARRWASALEQGYAHLEMLLVQRATEALEGYDADPDAVAEGIAPLTAKEAIQILRLHQSQVHGGGAAHPGWRARPRSLDDVRDSILTKLEAVAPVPKPGPKPGPKPAPKSSKPGG